MRQIHTVHTLSCNNLLYNTVHKHLPRLVLQMSDTDIDRSEYANGLIVIAGTFNLEY